jgi:hypothetical protein
MIVNVLGLAFCLGLAILGVWLANEFAEMKRIQDCVSSGRDGCVPLKLPAPSGRGSAKPNRMYASTESTAPEHGQQDWG